MPQIANQDYKIIAPTPGRALQDDAAALEELKKACLNGTIFDCLLKDTKAGEDDLNRVLGCYSNGSGVSYYTIGEETIIYMDLLYSPAQYAALSILQKEIDSIDGVGKNMPDFAATHNDSYLMDAESGYNICTPEGYQYKVSVVDSKIATIEVSTNKLEGNSIAISIEDAQKLVGITCTQS